MLWNALEAAAVPGIQGMWCHEAGYSHALTVVSLRHAYAGNAAQAAHLAAQLREAVYGGKHVVVVDEEMDPTNLQDVVRAICSRADPVKSVEFIPDASGITLIRWSSTVRTPGGRRSGCPGR